MGSIPHLSILKGPGRNYQPEYVHRLFEGVCVGSGEKTALIFEDFRHSYNELNERANQQARVLKNAIEERSEGRNNDGDYIIAVCLPPTDHLVQVLLAIWKCGAAYLPLDPSFPDARIEHILNESRPALVLHEDDKRVFERTTKISAARLHELAAFESTENLTDEHTLKHLKDDLAIVLYTSGSTGVPKGVRLPHRVLLNRLQWQFRAFPYGAEERTGIFKTALTFVDSVSEIWGPLLNGLAVLTVPKTTSRDPEKLIGLLEEYEVQRLVLVPSLLRSMLLYLGMQKGKSGLSKLKTWVCSGETLAVSLAAEFFEYFSEGGHELCNFYGSTEIMGDVSYHVIRSGEEIKYETKIPIGIPLDNTILYLLDKDLRPVKSGEVGELFVSGSNLAAGYVNGRDPEKFLDNPLAIDPSYSRLFRTGDFARVEKSVLQYEGRTDSQVKIRGHRVDLSEVEKAVGSVQGVEKCVVLCYKAGEMNQALLAFVQVTGSLGESQIEEILREKLASYMVPQVILIEHVPLLVNGKIDRQTLLTDYENANNHGEVQISYEGVDEKQMAAAKVLFETVAAILGNRTRSVISHGSNFYEIGGNSLNSIFTISSLAGQGYHITIADFISAMDLGEVLDRFSTADDAKLTSEPPIFRAELLANEHKDNVIDMITTSFYRKADLEQWLMPDIAEADYTELMDKIWEPLVEKRLSFVAISQESGKILGVALNFDAHDEPDVEIHSKLVVIFEFLESIEGPVRDKELPLGRGNVLHSFMMATHSELSSKENVPVMKFMEDEVLALAKSRDFCGIFTTNTSPLTQQLAESIYGYKVMHNCQVNKYVAGDGTKPFGLASDSQRAIVHWKPIK